MPDLRPFSTRVLALLLFLVSGSTRADLITNSALVPGTVSTADSQPGTAHVARVVPTPAKQRPATPPQGRGPCPGTILAWDAAEKMVNVKPGLTNAHFTFYVTNVSSAAVLVHEVRTSCGCANAKLPEHPWVVQPGASGPIQIDLNVAGFHGTAMKGILVDTSAGFKYLIVKANIPPPAPVLTNAAPIQPKASLN